MRFIDGGGATGGTGAIGGTGCGVGIGCGGTGCCGTGDGGTGGFCGGEISFVISSRLKQIIANYSRKLKKLKLPQYM